MIIYRDVRKLVADTCGATGIEYALVGSIVAVMIWGAVTLLGGELGSMFQSVTDAVTDAVVPGKAGGQ